MNSRAVFGSVFDEALPDVVVAAAEVGVESCLATVVEFLASGGPGFTLGVSDGLVRDGDAWAEKRAAGCVVRWWVGGEAGACFHVVPRCRRWGSLHRFVTEECCVVREDGGRWNVVGQLRAGDVAGKV